MVASLLLVHTIDTSFAPNKAECWFRNRLFLRKRTALSVHAPAAPAKPYRNSSTQSLIQLLACLHLDAPDTSCTDLLDSLRTTPGFSQDDATPHTILDRRCRIFIVTFMHIYSTIIRQTIVVSRDVLYDYHDDLVSSYRRNCSPTPPYNDRQYCTGLGRSLCCDCHSHQSLTL